MPQRRPLRRTILLRLPFPALTLAGLALVLLLAAKPLHSAGLPAASKPRPGPPCLPLADTLPQADSQRNPQPQPSTKEVCLQTHIYEVVELTDGTRFLDVCPPETSDQDCRFLLLSLHEDREEVGDLHRFRNQDIAIRGTIRRYRGRFGIQISHARQFDGGPEKFRPNPKLLRDFNAQSDRMPIRDPNLRSSGHHRTFMDRTLTESTSHADLPAPAKP